MPDFSDELDASAELGWGADPTAKSLDPETRHLELRLLTGASESDFAQLEAHPQSRALAQWLLTLPAYAWAYDDGDI